MTKMTFLLITFLTLLLFYLGTGKVKKIALISFIWLTFISLLAIFGYFKNTTSTPPRFIIVIIGSILLALYSIKTIDPDKIKFKTLLLLHSLRLPIEIGLWHLYLKSEIPKIMTFNGYNFDIIMGISALIIYCLLQVNHQKKLFKFMYYWNIMGILLLSVIVGIAILSAPFPFQQFALEQPNQALLKFPYVLLPGIIVPMVYASHFIALNRLKNVISVM
ncbi:hypothetical protein [Cellulophaga baltica]|uniref:hypothetical protein n=1 Tax=Cellulophaga baltica TaxID=76594 RepID=UPI002147695B|nr:hypothetical protein [Cellulophaga baltica]